MYKSTALEKQVVQSLFENMLWENHRLLGGGHVMDFCLTLRLPRFLWSVCSGILGLCPYVTAACCSQVLLFNGKDSEEVSSFWVKMAVDKIHTCREEGNGKSKKDWLVISLAQTIVLKYSESTAWRLGLRPLSGEILIRKVKQTPSISPIFLLKEFLFPFFKGALSTSPNVHICLLFCVWLLYTW